MVLTSTSVEASIRGYSSRVLDGLGLSRGRGEDGQYNISGCEVGRKMIHFWQVDGVRRLDLEPSIRRLKDYLQSQRWAIIDFASSPTVVNALLVAKNPADGYWIYVKGVQDLNRIAVQVSSPCFKIAETHS